MYVLINAMSYMLATLELFNTRAEAETAQGCLLDSHMTEVIPASEYRMWAKPKSKDGKARCNAVTTK